ncbi:MAG: flavin reductase family protein [Planctomycetota bacterium]
MTDIVSPLAQALGRVSSGLYIVTTQEGDKPLGFLGSFLIQVGFDPPTVAVAIGKERDHLLAVRECGHFTVSILDKESSGLMGTFFKKLPEGQSPYDELDLGAAPSGVPVLNGALGWLDCEVSGEHDAGDHIVVFGTVREGSMLREGTPSTHVRKNGLSY